MHASSVRIFLGILLSLTVAGCGGGGGGGLSTHLTAGGTAVVVTFTGSTPTAAATQIGTSAFAAAAIQGGKVNIFVPTGTTKYSVAYVCPPYPGLGNMVTAEYVIQASIQDGTAYTVSCFGAPTTGTATGTANATAIAGSANILIRGNMGYGGSVGSNNGAFSATMVTGTNDVAAIAVDSNAQPNVLAVQILRNQTVPGAINGGNTITFGAGDATTPQTLTVNNVPAGFVSPPAVAVQYVTANGTTILLDGNNATQYPAVAAADTQTGDYYSYEANSANGNSAVGVTQTTSTGGGAATISLPASWSYTGPTAAAFPTFTFTYSGFSGLAAVAQQGEIEWAPTPATLTTITVTATANYQSGATTIAMPNLTALTGFSGSATSGTNIFWVAAVYGGTVPAYTFPLPANATLSFVQNRGNYTEP